MVVLVGLAVLVRALWTGASPGGGEALRIDVDHGRWLPPYDDLVADPFGEDPTCFLPPGYVAPLWPQGETDVVLEYTLRAADGSVARLVSLDDLGRLIVVDRQGPLSADDLRTTLLAHEGADRLLALATGATGSAPHAEATDLGPEGTYVATVVLEDGEVASGLVEGLPAAAAPGRAEVDFAGLPGVLADLGWLTSDPEVVVEPEGPWAPEVALVTLAEPSGPAPPELVTWPATMPRLEPDRSEQTVRGADDVAAVLALFPTDERPVVDVRGALRTLDIAIDLPGETPVDPPPVPCVPG